MKILCMLSLTITQYKAFLFVRLCFVLDVHACRAWRGLKGCYAPCRSLFNGWLSVAAEDVAGVDLGLYVVERGVVAVGNDGL